MKRAPALILAFMLAPALVAETVAVAAAEGGGFRAFEATAEILTGALDIFFMEGFIVTSSEIQALGDASWPEASLAAARAGFVDYLLALEPSYAPTSEARPEISELRYRLLRVADGGTLREGRIVAGKPGLPSLAERGKALRALGSEAARSSIQAARGLFTGGR